MNKGLHLLNEAFIHIKSNITSFKIFKLLCYETQIYHTAMYLLPK